MAFFGRGRVARIALCAVLLAVVCAPAVVVAKEEEDGEQAEVVRAAPAAPSKPPAAPSKPPSASRRFKKVVATNKPGRSWKSPACNMPAGKSGMRKLRLTEPLAAASLASLAVGLATGALIPALVLAPAFAASAFLETKAAQYEKLVEDNTINVDEYTCQSPGFMARAKVAIQYSLSVGDHKRSVGAIPLGVEESTTVKGLKTSQAYNGGKGGKKLDLGSKKGLVIGTIRMGFGHHRIAYSTASWALEDAGFDQVVFHDLLNVESPEADLIRSADKLYSTGSRLASEIGGPVEKLWGSLMKSGDENAMRSTYQMAEQLRPLLNGIPKDTPIIATHCLVGLAAVACGFEKVINLVIDNYAQWFVIVPGAINLVQGPTNFAALQKMGVPDAEIRLAGHWCPKDLVDNIEVDCVRRTERAHSGKPLRLLIPVGGAGAQKSFVTSLLKKLKEPILAGKIQVLLNAGDHAHMIEAFVETLASMGITAKDYKTIDSIAGVHEITKKLIKGGEPTHAVTLFAFPDYFPAVAATDILTRVADVLVTKPSELAFYPVPKLHIRRVGDHEAFSALRASELGDGTLEIREVDEAVQWLDLMRRNPDLLSTFNDQIISNNRQGVYSGCKQAVELALELAKH